MPMVRVSNGGTQNIAYITHTGTGYYTLDVSATLSNYRTLTKNNFFLVPYNYIPSTRSSGASQYYTGSLDAIRFPQIVSYDSSTGQLTIDTLMWLAATGYVRCSVNLSVYVYYIPTAY